MNVFDSADGHEQVVYCRDARTGLKAIIAIYSTALGPALGGTRFYPYANEQTALRDVLDLSRAMAYKAACAGLQLGGGKAVILGDPAMLKTEALLRAYGKFVQSLSGRYYTACDVGTQPEDMDVVARETSYVSGRTSAIGGSGDSAILTAFGVHQAMRAAAELRWGTPSLRGRRVGVAGLGKVGRRLIEHLLYDGARVLGTDAAPTTVARVRSEVPDVDLVELDALSRLELDIYAPCAMGGALDPATVDGLKADIVCGAANNQLAFPEADQTLQDKGVLYVPDFVANAGGLIQVADEIAGYSEPRARTAATQIFATVQEIIATAQQDNVTPTAAATRMAATRIAAAEGRPLASMSGVRAR